MALETLKDVKKIGGFDVAEISDFTKERPLEFIVVNHKNNGLSFLIQNGPIKEVGVNGCQVDTIIETARTIIYGLNKKFPCRENSLAITKLEEALMWLNKRKVDRVDRGVEGFSKE